MGNVQTPSIVKKVKRNKELEKYTKPTGLYENCPYDDRTVRKWVLNRTLAPIYRGSDTPSDTTEECPICFMHYEAINRSTCCKKTMCTECYLQIKPPRTTPDCPFCNSAKFGMKYMGALSEEERETIKIEEQKMIEAKIRLKQDQEKEEMERRKKQQLDSEATPNPPPSNLSPPVPVPPKEEDRPRMVSDDVYVPLASPDDRRKMEEELRRNRRAESGHIYDSPFQQTSRSRRAGSSNRSDWEEDFFSALGSDTSSVEEMMLREALRRSKLEHDFREVGRAANAGNNSGVNTAMLPPNRPTVRDTSPLRMANESELIRPAALQRPSASVSSPPRYITQAMPPTPPRSPGRSKPRLRRTPSSHSQQQERQPDVARAAAEEIGMDYEEQLKLAIALSLEDTSFEQTASEKTNTKEEPKVVTPEQGLQRMVAASAPPVPASREHQEGAENSTVRRADDGTGIFPAPAQQTATTSSLNDDESIAALMAAFEETVWQTAPPAPPARPCPPVPISTASNQTTTDPEEDPGSEAGTSAYSSLRTSQASATHRNSNVSEAFSSDISYSEGSASSRRVSLKSSGSAASDYDLATLLAAAWEQPVAPQDPQPAPEIVRPESPPGFVGRPMTPGHRTLTPITDTDTPALCDDGAVAETNEEPLSQGGDWDESTRQTELESRNSNYLAVRNDTHATESEPSTFSEMNEDINLV